MPKIHADPSLSAAPVRLERSTAALPSLLTAIEADDPMGVGPSDVFSGGGDSGLRPAPWTNPKTGVTFRPPTDMTFDGNTFVFNNGVRTTPGWGHGTANENLTLSKLGLGGLVRYDASQDRKNGLYNGHPGYKYIDQFYYKFGKYLQKFHNPTTAFQRALADMRRINGGTLVGTGLTLLGGGNNGIRTL